MANTGAIYTGATLIVLVYSLYASYLLSWKFDAGPVLYFFIFVCFFVLLRLAVSPLVDLWARGQSTIQTVTATAEDPQIDPDTCSALFTDPSTGDLMDAMTGYKSEPPIGHTCPNGFVPMPSATNPAQASTDPSAAETPLPTGSSFFHYCTAAPAAPSRVSVRSFTPTSQAKDKRSTPSNNRYTFYSEY